MPQVVHIPVAPEHMVVPPDVFQVAPVVQVRPALFQVVLVPLQEPVPQHGLHSQLHGPVLFHLEADKPEQACRHPGNAQDAQPLVKRHARSTSISQRPG